MKIQAGQKLEKGVKDYEWAGPDFYSAYLGLKDLNIAINRISPLKMDQLYEGFEDENRQWLADFSGLPVYFSLRNGIMTLFPIPERKDLIFKIIPE